MRRRKKNIHLSSPIPHHDLQCTPNGAGPLDHHPSAGECGGGVNPPPFVTEGPEARSPHEMNRRHCGASPGPSLAVSFTRNRRQ